MTQSPLCTNGIQMEKLIFAIMPLIVMLKMEMETMCVLSMTPCIPKSKRKSLTKRHRTR